MSDTPRTDEVLRRGSKEHQLDGALAVIALARQLERELATERETMLHWERVAAVRELELFEARLALKECPTEADLHGGGDARLLTHGPSTGESASVSRLHAEGPSITPSSTAPTKREVMVYANCPRCGAKDEADAQVKCLPGEDQCPMTCRENWADALGEINERLIAEQDGVYWEMQAKIDDLTRQLAEARGTPSATALNADNVIEWIAGQTKVQHVGPGWCLTDQQIRDLKGKYAAGVSASAQPVRYTPVAPTEEQRRIVWESGLANIGDARLVWVNEGDFWNWKCMPKEMLAPSKPASEYVGERS